MAELQSPDDKFLREEDASKKPVVLSGLAGWLNLGSAIFNLMNAVIGAGIISLGYAASVLGSAQFIIWLILVVVVSCFTMDLVLACSKQIGCWEAMQAEKNHNEVLIEPRRVCPRTRKCDHTRYFSYETFAEKLFGIYVVYFVNIIMFFYLCIAITTYFIIMKDNLPDIVEGILNFRGINTEDVDRSEIWYLNGKILLGLMVIIIQLPLACLRRIDFLGFTSFIGMACMMSFVGLVIAKQPEAAALCGKINYTEPNPEPSCETELFTFSVNSVYAIPMMLFSFMCHGNILSIVAELRPLASCKSSFPSIKRTRMLIAGSVSPTTILYILTALFAYNSYFNRTESFLLKQYGYWLNGDIMLLAARILVTVCITFSVPILHYPCRYSLWKLLNRLAPKTVPTPYDNGFQETWNPIWFRMFAIVIQGCIYALVCITDDFKLVLSLGGAIAGSCIIQIFPSMFYLKIHDWDHRGAYNKLVWLILGLGWVTFFFNTSLIIIQSIAARSDGGENDFHDEQNKVSFELMGRGFSNFTDAILSTNTTA